LHHHHSGGAFDPKVAKHLASNQAPAAADTAAAPTPEKSHTKFTQ
jgi:hypothetical protein